MADKLRVGLIGCGGIANGAHIPGYLASETGEITAVCDIDESALNRTGDRLNIPAEMRFKNYPDVINHPDIDAVDICTPNYLHCEIAMASIKAGKPFSTEKPMGMNYQETMKVVNAAKAAGIPGFICFSWRYNATARYMKKLISDGLIGRVYHIYIRCIKDSGLWNGRMLEWRFQKELAGSGVLCDLGSHMFDITRFIGEEIKSVYAETGIYIQKRKRIENDEIAEVTTDDWVNVLAQTENNVNVTYQITRLATCVPNSIIIEIYGEKGQLIFDCNKAGLAFRPFVDTRYTKSEVQMLEVPVEFKAVQSQSFIDMCRGINDSYTSHIEEGAAGQRIIDAALISAETGRRVMLDEVKE